MSFSFMGDAESKSKNDILTSKDRGGNGGGWYLGRLILSKEATNLR